MISTSYFADCECDHTPIVLERAQATIGGVTSDHGPGTA